MNSKEWNPKSEHLEIIQMRSTYDKDESFEDSDDFHKFDTELNKIAKRQILDVSWDLSPYSLDDEI